MRDVFLHLNKLPKTGIGTGEENSAWQYVLNCCDEKLLENIVWSMSREISLNNFAGRGSADKRGPELNICLLPRNRVMWIDVIRPTLPCRLQRNQQQRVRGTNKSCLECSGLKTSVNEHVSKHLIGTVAVGYSENTHTSHTSLQSEYYI